MNYPVKTAEKTLRIIEALQAEDQRTVTEIAEETDMNKSTVYNHLQTLLQNNYAIEEERGYRLGLKFLALGGHARQQLELYKVAKPEVNNLAEETAELANLMVEENGMGVHLDRSKGDKALDLDSYVGMRTPLNTTSLGKAIMSQMPEERVTEIIDRYGLPAVTENTITDRDRFMEEVETISDRGYSVDDGERLQGLYCVAAPIQIEDEIYAAISVSAPATRITSSEKRNEIAERVRNAANVVQLNLES